MKKFSQPGLDGLPQSFDDEYEILGKYFKRARYGKGGGSPPPAPDPVATANAQAAANKETAITQAFLNNVNQSNPLGSVEFDSFKDPNTGLDRFSSTTTLNPLAQRAFDAEQGLAAGTNELAAGQLGRIEDAVSDPFSFEGLPGQAVAGVEGRQKAEDAVFDSLSRRLNNQFDRDEDRLRGRLATQGITQGSEAFGSDLDQFNTNKNDAFLDAANQAFLAGGAEQNRQFGLDATARDRGVQERSFLRNIPLNEVAALLGTGQVGIPNFGGPAQTGVAPTDVIGATLGSARIAQDRFAQQQAGRNAFNKGLFGLGSAGLGAAGTLGAASILSSDRRLKTNIQKIGRMANGLFVYVYNYIWGGPKQIGVMADEVMQVIPSAVVMMDNGFYAVDYSEVLNA